MQVQICPGCGEENPARFRLCGFCGTPLAQAVPPTEVRKTVTIVFSDLQGSTALGEQVDPEAIREIKNVYFDAMASVLSRHGGRIEKYIGDAIMAVFGLPRVREDDALRAVKAAAGMQAELTRLNADFERAYGIALRARIGVNTGQVVATGDATADQRLADGDAVNVAARLEQAAPAMEVLIGDITWQLVRDHVAVETVEPLELKGKAGRVPAYRLLALRAASDAALAQRAPFIGREEELAQLRDAFSEALERDRPTLVTLVGDAGVGKSRLLSEYVAGIGEQATVLRGRCLPYGDGITFWPMVEITRQAAGIDEEDHPEAARTKISGLLPADDPDSVGIVDRVASTVGLSSSAFPVSELFWGIRSLLETLARPRPLVLLVDDIHTAEPTFLELMEHLVDTAEAPIVLVCSSRRDLLDRAPDWGVRDGARRIILEPLSVDDGEQMVDRILGDAGLSPDLRRRIAEAAGGNPLFVEQMVSMLVQRGQVKNEAGRWVAAEPLSELEIPHSIQALLASRLDDLGREERAVLEPASVIGLNFPEPAVEELVGDAMRPAVATHLEALSRKQFVAPANVEEGTYRFHHLLIRDTTYQSLLKRARATLHERFATWAERVNAERDREIEFEEILGYHLEQAFRYRQELGALGEEGRETGRRASTKLASAGRRASARGDMPAAASLLRRAVAVLAPDDDGRRELLPYLAEVLIELGHFDEAIRVLDDGASLADERADDRFAARVSLERAAIHLFRSGASTESDSSVIDNAIAVFERDHDDAGLARAWRLVMFREGTAGHFENAASAADRFSEHATRAGDRRLAAAAATGYAMSALLGSTAVPEAIVRCDELLAQVVEDRKATAVISGVLGVLYAMEGGFDRARSLAHTARAFLEELGPSLTAASTSTESSRIETLAGNHAAAERDLRRDYEALTAMGETYLRSSIAGFLARSLYAQDQFEEAARFTQITRTLAADDDAEAQMLWRSVEARLLARNGDAAGALALAEEAVTLARETSSLGSLAGALVDVAEVHRLLGRDTFAEDRLQEALALYQRKGDVVSADRVGRRLGELKVLQTQR